MQVTNLINMIEQAADPDLSADWDNSGIQVAGTRSEIQKLAIALDPTEENIVNALEQGADFILTHHPLKISPKFPNKRNKYHNILTHLLQSGTWLYSAHTSLDVQTTGPVSWLAKELELNDLQAVEPISPLPKLKLEAKIQGDIGFVSEYIKNNYPNIQTLPTGRDNLTIYCNHQFRNVILHIITTLAACIEIEEKNIYNPGKPCGYGLIGRFAQAIPEGDFSGLMSKILDMNQWTQAGNRPQSIEKVSYCPGSGMDIASKAFSLGADVFISGDLKYHQAQDLEDYGLTIDVGHFVLEEKMMRHWSKEMDQMLAKEDMQIIFIPGTDPLQKKTV